MRLDSAALLQPYGQPTTIAGHRSWLRTVDRNNRSECDATVVSHLGQSPSDATEMIEVTAQAAVPDQTLCTRASDLAATAVTRVPPT
ncbi:MAG: hypothetical protein JO100_10050 [Pseudonocardia sp.]|nr:hypothetical protein [Pseudonocardia sp.]